MTTVPIQEQPYPQNEATGASAVRRSSDDSTYGAKTPVLALKELVARLQREQNKIQDLLISLGFALRSFNNLNQFLELIPLMVSRVTDADGGALVLFKPNGQLRLDQVHCHDTHHCQDIRKALETINRQMIAMGEEVFHPEELAAKLDQAVGQFLGETTRLFGTAILVKKTERGRLYVFSRNPDYTWTETRQKLVRLVADQTAVAIENDELSVELRKKERLDRELEIGAEIQNQLLPHQCPTIQGVELAARCQTAGRVGGDYYDFIPIHPRPLRVLELANPEIPLRWSLTIGDVMGKGVPAGLIMTMLRGMLRAEVLNGHSPARILQHLNQVMYADLENSNRFVTLFYSEYDPLTRTLSYSNAAHNPPLLWQATTKTIKRLDTMGMLIGLDMDSDYEDAQVQLHPGDTVIYYTDGFTDASNKQGDRFDEDNLIQVFRNACQQYTDPQVILNHLFNCVQEFIGSDNHTRDDMTLVVIRVQPTP